MNINAALVIIMCSIFSFGAFIYKKLWDFEKVSGPSSSVVKTVSEGKEIDASARFPGKRIPASTKVDPSNYGLNLTSKGYKKPQIRRYRINSEIN